MTNLTADQIKTLSKVYSKLDALNTLIHQGKTINENDEILNMIELLGVEFQDELIDGEGLDKTNVLKSIS